MSAPADYTERARSMLEQWMREWGGETRPYAGSMMMDLQMRVAAAFSAVASERDAALHAAPSPSVVDYTERALQAARDAIESVPSELWIDRRNSETIAQAIAPDFAEFASAVASERDATAIRAFGQRVWSDTEEVAYQAGVRDTRVRLQEPDVLRALRRAIVAIKSRPVSTGRDFAQEDQDARDIAVLTKIEEMLT